MEMQNIDAVEILKIDEVEIFHTEINHKGKLVTKGPLYLLFAKEHNWFILKVNHFCYGLSKTIPVLASRQERGVLRAYVLVDKEGFFVLTISSVQFPEDIERLEYVLKQNTEFAYKEGPDGQGFPIEVGNGIVKIKQVPGVKTNESSKDTARLIYEGGKFAKKTMISAAETISLGINKIGNYVQTNYLQKEEKKEINPQTVSKIAFLNSATGMVTSMSTFYIRGLMSIGTIIAQKIELQFEKRENDKEIEQLKEKANSLELRTPLVEEEEKQGSGNVAFAVIHSAITIWQGMAEALDIIREEFTSTTSGIVSHKYGQVAGEVFRAGVGVAGNVGLPGTKFFKR